ncbi:GNAT family N-acetyltransferase [Legionella sp. 16cNR16C]|uniref:GNAT family N-acetyltransferase n=1 Tax=Legionella sp. 16cNR16C TaxID=2905656 RepID=UPI001E648CC8|nr:GNAT family N-acetyltransferase [Legionella sp. 16cNR16C]MCE3043538.1 GNAT family N-acetyltransferase [Legionella sp. 16cNR16C]
MTISHHCEIKKAMPEDAQAIIEFLNAVGGETDFLTFGLNEFPLSVEDESKIIDECISEERNLMLVGKVNDQIISQLFLETSAQSRLKHIGYIGLTVLRNYWGQKVGSQMLAQAIEWAKQKQLAKLQLQVRTDNYQAIQLYKKFGFVCEGTVIKALRIGEHYFDDFLMGLMI